jgi:hypothetical protein
VSKTDGSTLRDALAGKIRLAVVLADVVHGDEVRVVADFGHDLRLAPHPRSAVRLDDGDIAP